MRFRQRHGLRDGASGERQANDEPAALIRTRAASFDPAVMQFDESFRQAQADTQPLFARLNGLIQLRKHLEHVLELIGGNSDARVLHHDFDMIAIAARG